MTAYPTIEESVRTRRADIANEILRERRLKKDMEKLSDEQLRRIAEGRGK